MKTTVLLLTLGLAFASAYGQTPTPTPPCAACTPGGGNQTCPVSAPTPNESAEQFGTFSDTGGVMPLYWDVYLPNESQPPDGWPVVILVNDGGFQMGRRCDGNMKCIAGDLTANHFVVVSIDIRHDVLNQMPPRENLPCQTDAAYSPQYSRNQVSDLKQAINKARTPGSTDFLYGKVNHKVGAIGGSGGGAHVAWCAATGTPGNGNNEKLDAAVCLSGAYDFDEATSLADSDPGNMYGFCTNVTTYCRVSVTNPPMQCTDHSLENNQALTDASPIGRMDSSTAPLLAFATTADFMPDGQFDAICKKVNDLNMAEGCEDNECCGDAANTDYRAILFHPDTTHQPTNKHSFAYWFDHADAVNEDVDLLAIAFLHDHLDTP